MKKTFKNKDILVTGGCGSIGSELIRQLLTYKPKRIRVFDQNESGQFHLQKNLKSSCIRSLVGNIRDKERVKRAMDGVDIVFHAAALKHVPLCEYNPFEAVYTNVFGTQNLIDAAREEGVSKFISISTDKAVNPINTMGATKLLMEKLVTNANIGKSKTKFACVRFGNVLASEGSVMPFFKKQIKEGGPVTITSPEMTRFFMSKKEAINLILKTAKIMNGREIFILKMDSFKIMDLAEIMIEELALKLGHNPKDIKIKIIGIRPGEKINESLITEEEFLNVKKIENMFIIKDQLNIPHSYNINKYQKENSYNSKNIKILNKQEIKELLKTHKLI